MWDPISAALLVLAGLLPGIALGWALPRYRREPVLRRAEVLTLQPADTLVLCTEKALSAHQRANLLDQLRGHLEGRQALVHDDGMWLSAIRRSEAPRVAPA